MKVLFYVLNINDGEKNDMLKNNNNEKIYKKKNTAIYKYFIQNLESVGIHGNLKNKKTL